MKGYKVVGPNGNSIYLPAAGYHSYYIDEEVWTLVDDFDKVGSWGYYWSSSLDVLSPFLAHFLNFDYQTFVIGGIDRAFGCSVRPVFN